MKEDGNTLSNFDNDYPDDIEFRTQNTERLRITGGDVGIGTTNPMTLQTQCLMLSYQLVLSPQTNTLVMVLI